MSQVIRSYLQWPSFTAHQRGVPSHTDRGIGVRLGLFVKAVATILTRPRRVDDVVVCHLSEGGSFVREGLILTAASMRGVATVAQLHGSRFVEFAERRPRLVRFVLRRSRKALALNEDAAETARRMAPGLSVVILPNAVDAAPLRAKEDLVVFGGEVGTRKGADLLVRAWRELDDRRGFRLVFAGPVADESVVDQSEPDVEYLGAVTHDQLLSLLDRSRIACLPSHKEGLPMFVLEAMGRWNCVISTRVGGTPDVLKDGAGVLIDAGDRLALREALSSSMRPGQPFEFAARAHARVVDSYSKQVVFPRIEHEWLTARRP